MTNQQIDNQVDLGDVILWQYQHAWNLKALVGFYEDFFEESVEQFHDDWRDRIFNIEQTDETGLVPMDAFSLALWGAVLGYSRPTYKDNSTGADVPVSDALYRKILKARFRVMRSNASIPALLKYVNDVFGKLDANGNVRCNVFMDDTADMALHFSVKYPNDGTGQLTDEESELIATNPDAVFVYPSGVKTNERCEEIVFGFEGQNTNRTASEPEVGGFDDSTFANAWSVA